MKKENGRKRKQLLAVLLALGLVGSGIDYGGLLSVYGQESEREAIKQSETGQQAGSEGKTEENGAVSVQNTVVTEKVNVDTSYLPDNDELFAAYVERQLYPERAVSMFANYGESRLEGKNLMIYRELKAKIADLAQNGGSAEYQIQADLGISWVTAVTDWNWDAIELEAGEKFAKEVNINAIIDCLLVDCPYEFYWYDKVNGAKMWYSMEGSINTEAQHVVTISELTFSFSVAEAYQGANESTVDSAKAGAAQSAVKKANEIVAANAGKSDYEKLLAYNEEICDLVDYNHDALNPGTPYGDPWQLIHVFDGDKSTNVVCEGYSKAFQYLCDLTSFAKDVTCYTVTGEMGGGTGAGPHMWNIVNIGGKNYLVDVTNSDEGTIGSDGNLFLAGTTDGNADTGYTFRAGGGEILYTYDIETTQMYDVATLTMADTKYVPSVQKPSDQITIVGDSLSKKYDGTAFAVSAEKGTHITWKGSKPAVIEGYYLDQGMTQTTMENSGAASAGAAPANAGSYYAKVTVEEDDTYEKTTAYILFTISPADVSTGVMTVEAAQYYTGNAVTPAVKVWADAAKTTELKQDRDYTVSYKNNVNIHSGTGTGAPEAVITGIKNYTGTITKNFAIQYYDGAVAPKFNGQDLSDGWYGTDVAVTADGFMVSDKLAGSFSEKYIVSADAPTDITLYFKQNGTGYITDGKNYTVKFDKTAPAFSADKSAIQVKGNAIKNLLNKITFDLFFKDATVDVTLTASDKESGLDNYYYYLDNSGSAEVLSSDVLESKKFTEDADGKFDISAEDDYVIYAYATDKAGNKSDYVCSEGFVIDRTAPKVTVKALAEEDIKDMSATAKVQMNEAGTVTYVVTDTKNDSITAEAILADAAKKTVNVTEANKDVAIEITSLNPVTTYYIYAVGTDRLGNTGDAAGSSFTTGKTWINADSVKVTAGGTYGTALSDLAAVAEGMVKTSLGAEVAGTWAFADTQTVGGNTVSSSTVFPEVKGQSYKAVFTPSENPESYGNVLTVEVVPEIAPRSLTEDGVMVGEVAGSYTYDGTEKKPSVTVTDSKAKIVAADYTFTYENNINAGTAKVIIHGTRNYTGTVERSFQIGKGAGHAAVTLAGWTYSTDNSGAQNPVPVSETNGTGSVTYQYKVKGAEDSAYSTSVPNLAGDYTVKAEFAENENYNAATATCDFTIAKAMPELSVNAVTDKTYKDADFNLVVNYKGESPVTYKSGDESVLSVDEDGKVSIHKAGTAVITVSMEESANYQAKSVEVTVTVNKKAGTLHISKLTYDVSYGDADFSIGVADADKEGESKVTYTSSNADVVSVDADGTVSICGGGEAVITIAMAESANYKAVSEEVVIRVAKIAGEGTVSMKGWIYGGTAEAPVAVSNTNGTEAVTYMYKVKGTNDSTYTEKVPENVGTYTVKATFAETNNYLAVTAEADFEIIKAVKPENTPNQEIPVIAPADAEKLEDVPLPKGWVWAEEVKVIPGGYVTAKAVYSDTDNYEPCEVELRIAGSVKIVESATDDEYVISKDKEAVIKCTGVLEELVSVEVDGKEVDASNYTLKSGSTILTFKKEYLDTLSLGKHIVKLNYTAASTEVSLTVKKPEEQTGTGTTNTDTTGTGKNETNPANKVDTGDHTMPWLWAVLMAVSCAGVTSAVLGKRKNRR